MLRCNFLNNKQVSSFKLILNDITTGNSKYNIIDSLLTKSFALLC